MTLRPARWSDALFLLRLANDPAMVAARLEPRRIGLCEHLRWMRRTLANSDVALYIAEVGGRRVGEIRLDRMRGPTWVGLVVSPKYRGRGYGSEMIHAAVSSMPDRLFFAQIKPENAASWKAFERAGFQHIGRTAFARYVKEGA